MLSRAKNLDFLCYVLAFSLPSAALGLVYIKFGIYPFGEKTVLVMDLGSQYVDYYAAYYEIFTQGKSLLYSWEAGLGLNFLGLFAYYLASPFSFLLLIFPKESLTEALLLLTLLKVGAAGFTFAIYTRYLSQANFMSFPSPTPNPTPTSTYSDSSHSFIPSRNSMLIFSVLYALMGYSVVYSFNLMWLDGVIFLPLVLLGTEKLVRENKAVALIISLAVMFLANYYTAYMAGLFTLLFFCADFFSLYSWKYLKVFLHKLSIFLFSALLAAGCSAVLLIPAFFALLNAQSGPDLSFGSWVINFDFFDLLTKTQPGAYDTLGNSGLPNIYSGLLTLLLLPLYFLNQRIPGKERLLYGLLMGFLLVSFNFSYLNIFWHAFDSPNAYPYRYSFVFSLLMIFLAFRSFLHLHPQDLARLAKSFLGWMLLIIVLQKNHYPYLNEKLLISSILLLAVYALLLSGWTTASRLVRSICLLLITCFILVEISLNTWFLIQGLHKEYGFLARQGYEQSLSRMEPLIAEIHALDKDACRLDRIGGRTMNDSLNLSYHGIAHYSSLAGADLNYFLRQLGFLSIREYRAINFAGSTPVTESLLGIKYVIAAEDKGLGYTEVLDQGELKAYRNKFALPLGFLSDQALGAFDPAQDDNPFRLQNKLVNLALGKTEVSSREPFQPLAITGISLANANSTIENGKEVLRRVDPAQEGSIEYTLFNPRNQQIYASFQTINQDIRLFLNGKKIPAYLPVYNKRILDLGYHPGNSSLKIKVSFGGSGITLTEKYFYGLSEANLAKVLGPLQNHVLQNVSLSDTSVQGEITVPEERKHLLFTSIPYDPGWKATVDGREAPLQKIGGAFIGLELEPGRHHVLFSYQPAGFQAGIVISGISLVTLLFYLLRQHYKKRDLP